MSTSQNLDMPFPTVLVLESQVEILDCNLFVELGSRGVRLT